MLKFNFDSEGFRRKVENALNEQREILLLNLMEYAMYVESKSKDVLTSAELFALREVPKMLQNIKNL